MNKKELLSKTSNETGFAHVLIESAFDEIIRIIADEIEAGREVTISGFGNFSSKFIKGKEKIHNITKEIINVPDRLDPRFKFSTAFKKRINSKN